MGQNLAELLNVLNQSIKRFIFSVKEKSVFMGQSSAELLNVLNQSINQKIYFFQ